MVLQTRQLTKRYGKQIALNKVSLNINQGDIYGLIGKNGAGKTTIMKLICGLAKATDGAISLFDSDDLEKGRRRLGCVIEQPAIYPLMSARENLVYYSKLIGLPDDSEVDELLEIVGLKDVGKKKAKKFSLGMKQRLSIAISLIGHPDFLILDESINGLDPAGIREVRELILKLNSEKNITVLISSHLLGELSKVATVYGVVDKGNLVAEFTKEELEERCKKCLEVTVNDTQKATYVLEKHLEIHDYEVLDNNLIRIYEKNESSNLINKALIQNDVDVINISFKSSDVEAYFVKMMGGEE